MKNAIIMDIDLFKKKTNNMKQSAVEWLVQQFETIVFYSEEAKENTIEQAKEMEEQQKGYSEEDLECAFQSGFTNGFNMNSVTFEEWFEQFKNK
jgi:hypothetical protein